MKRQVLGTEGYNHVYLITEEGGTPVWVEKIPKNNNPYSHQWAAHIWAAVNPGEQPLQIKKDSWILLYYPTALSPQNDDRLAAEVLAIYLRSGYIILDADIPGNFRWSTTNPDQPVCVDVDLAVRQGCEVSDHILTNLSDYFPRFYDKLIGLEASTFPKTFAMIKKLYIFDQTLRKSNINLFQELNYYPVLKNPKKREEIIRFFLEGHFPIRSSDLKSLLKGLIQLDSQDSKFKKEDFLKMLAWLLRTFAPALLTPTVISEIFNKPKLQQAIWAGYQYLHQNQFGWFSKHGKASQQSTFNYISKLLLSVKQRDFVERDAKQLMQEWSRKSGSTSTSRAAFAVQANLS